MARQQLGPWNFCNVEHLGTVTFHPSSEFELHADLKGFGGPSAEDCVGTTTSTVEQVGTGFVPFINHGQNYGFYLNFLI